MLSGFFALLASSACGDPSSPPSDRDETTDDAPRARRRRPLQDAGLDAGSVHSHAPPPYRTSTAERSLSDSLTAVDEQAHELWRNGVGAQVFPSQLVTLEFNALVENHRTNALIAVDEYIQRATTFFEKLDALGQERTIPDYIITTQRETKLRTEIELYQELQNGLTSDPVRLFNAQDVATDGAELQRIFRDLLYLDGYKITVLKGSDPISLVHGKSKYSIRFYTDVCSRIKAKNGTVPSLQEVLPDTVPIRELITSKKTETIARLESIRQVSTRLLEKYDHFPFFYKTEDGYRSYMITSDTNSESLKIKSLLRIDDLNTYNDIALGIENIRLFLPILDSLVENTSAVTFETLMADVAENRRKYRSVYEDGDDGDPEDVDNEFDYDPMDEEMIIE